MEQPVGSWWVCGNCQEKNKESSISCAKCKASANERSATVVQTTSQTKGAGPNGQFQFYNTGGGAYSQPCAPATTSYLGGAPNGTKGSPARTTFLFDKSKEKNYNNAPHTMPIGQFLSNKWVRVKESDNVYHYYPADGQEDNNNCDQCEADLRSAEAKAEALRKQLADAQKRISDLNWALEAEKEARAKEAANKQPAAADCDCDEQMAQIMRQKAMIERLMGQNEELKAFESEVGGKSGYDALKKKLADAQEGIKDRDGIIQARDKTIEDLRKALASAGSADGGNKELIAQLQKQIDDLKKKNEDLQKKNEDLQKQLDAAGAGSSGARAEAEKAKKDLEEAQGQLAVLKEKEQIQNDLANEAKAEFEKIKPFVGCQFVDYKGKIKISKSLEGSPADSAGMDDEDVVTSVDKVPTRSKQEFTNEIIKHLPGDDIVIRIERMQGGVEHHHDRLVTVGSRQHTLRQVRELRRKAEGAISRVELQAAWDVRKNVAKVAVKK